MCNFKGQAQALPVDLCLPLKIHDLHEQNQGDYFCVFMVPRDQEKTPAWQRQSREGEVRDSLSLGGLARQKQDAIETVYVTSN